MKQKVLLASAALLLIESAAAAPTVTLSQVGLQTFSNPIGIDYFEPLNSMVFSLNYPTGLPSNFARLDIPTGTFHPFSSIAGLTEELKIATVRSAPNNPGGWPVGTMFTGSGTDGQITRINPDGSLFGGNPAWVDLPGDGNGLMRGSLYVDRTGAWNGDLIAVTTAGQVWRVDGAGTPSPVANVGTHLEGMITVPDDAARYGPLAGRIIAGAEAQGLMYAFSQDGSFTTHALGVNIEDIDLIIASENFFGVNFGNQRILAAPASDFAPYVGDILLAQEGVAAGESGLYRLSWDGSKLVTEQFILGLGSAAAAPQWEHVSFGATAIPEPSTYALMSLGLLGLGIAVRRRRQ